MAKIGRPSNAPARRKEVLELAAEIFSQRGYRGTSMNEIAAAGGISKPTLYHYFRSKEEILVSLYEDVMNQSVAEAHRIAQEVEDPAEAMRALIAQRVVATCTNRAMFKVFFEEEEALPAGMVDVILLGRREYENVLKGMLLRATADTGCEPALNPTVFVNTCLGAANWVYKWYDPKGPLSPEEIGRQVAHHLLVGLAGPAGAVAAKSASR